MLYVLGWGYELCGIAAGVDFLLDLLDPEDGEIQPSDRAYLFVSAVVWVPFITLYIAAFLHIYRTKRATSVYLGVGLTTIYMVMVAVAISSPVVKRAERIAAYRGPVILILLGLGVVFQAAATLVWLYSS